MATFQDSPTNLPDPWGVAQGVSIPTIKFEFQDEYGNRVAARPGTEYTLRTTEDLDSVQQRNFDTQELEFWDDGRPKVNLVVTGDLVSTNVPPEQYTTGDDDQLKRRFFFKGQSLQALQQAIKQAGIQRFGIGTEIKITLTGQRPPKSGRGYPTKLYAVEFGTIADYVAPEQRQVEGALAASTPASPVHQQAQTSFAPAQAPVASAAPVQAVAAPVQDQQVAQPVAAAPTPQPAASVAQQIAQAPIPEAAPAAPAGNGPQIKADYEQLLSINIDHDLAVSSLAKKYEVDQSVVVDAIAI